MFEKVCYLWLSQQPTNCLSVFDHFAVLVLKGLTVLKSLLDKSHFGDNGLQNYLDNYQQLLKLFTTNTNKDRILAWKSKGLSEESIKPHSTLSRNLVLRLTAKIRLKFDGISLGNIA